MATSSLDNILKKVVQEIIRELKNKNVDVKENFVSYYVNLLTLDPNWGIAKNVLYNRIKIQKFVKFVTTKLSNQWTPNITTLKMQFYFSFNFGNRRELVKKNKTDIKSRLTVLETEILNVFKIPDEAGVNRLYQRIIYYITILAGMGNPTKEPVYKEVTAALKSVLSESELFDFVGRHEGVRKEKLLEYHHLVAGIRLFNRDIDKGGEGIDNLPRLIKKALEIALAEYHQGLEQVMEKVNTFTTMVDRAYSLEPNQEGKAIIDCWLPEGVTPSDLEMIKELLVMYRQFEIYLRKLIKQAEKVDAESKSILRNLKYNLRRVHDTVRMRIVIPSEEVFPLFKELSEVWFELQEQTMLLAKLNEIFSNLCVYAKQTKTPEFLQKAEIMEAFLGPLGPMTDAQRLKACTNTKVDRRKLGMIEGTYFTMHDQDLQTEKSKKGGGDHAEEASKKKIDFQYLGFCAWKLVATGGSLIPGNPAVGALKLMGRNYVFSSVEALEMFAQDSERKVMEALTIIRSKPELVPFLKMYDMMVYHKDKDELLPPISNDILVYQKACQTDTHPACRKIVPTYKWNIWDLKREAEHLAQISNCLTNSTQTDECGGVSSVKTQTYEPKEQHVQTKQENYSNVPKPSTFIFGLRGRKDDKQFKVDLTRPVKE